MERIAPDAHSTIAVTGIEASEDRIRQALERVCSSPPLVTSERRRAFLRYVVEETLAGRGERIKAYCVAVAVFDRPHDFDPQADPVVRIEAGRLRRALDDYYSGPGSDDPLRIVIPKGRYLPHFVEALPEAENDTGSDDEDAEPALAGADVTTEHRRPRGRLLRRTVILAVAVLMAGGWAAFYATAGGEGADRAHPAATRTHAPLGDPQPVATLAPRPVQPAILVLAFEHGDGALHSLAHALRTDILHGLLRYDSIAIFDAMITLEEGSGEPPLRIARNLHADYLLAGSVAREGGRLRLEVRMIAARDGTTVWGKILEKPLPAHRLANARDRLAAEVARSIAQPYGVIHRDLVRTASSGLGASDVTGSTAAHPRDEAHTGAYVCVVQAYEYRRAMRASGHRLVRDCLEEAIEEGPAYAPALAHLAFLYLDEHRYGYNPRPGARPLAEAAGLARAAVALDPTSAVAFQALFNTHIFERDFEAAFALAERALAASPHNPEIQAVYGLRLALHGKWRRGLDLVHKALAGNPWPPGWYHFPLALDHYRKDELSKALRAARRIDMPDFLFQHVVMAAIHARRGELEAARRLVARVSEHDPVFMRRPRAMLAQQIQDEELLQRMLTDLAKAGLRVEPQQPLHQG